MKSAWKHVPLAIVLKRADRFENKEELRDYRFAGTYSFGRGIFAGETKQGSTFQLPKVQRVKADDFIYCKIMAWEGAFGVAPKAVEGCVLSGAFVVYEIDRTKLEPSFIDYYFKMRNVWKLIGSQSTGTNIRRRSLHPDQLEKATIPLPPLPEQRRIVAKIEELVAKMDEIQDLRETVDKSILSFTLSLHKRLSGSHIVKIGELIELSEDRQEIKAENDYPQIGIRGFGGGLFPKAASHGSETTYRYFNRLKADQIVLSQVKGWEGAIAVCPPEMEGYYASPEYRTFSCKCGDCDPAYMSFLVRTPWFHGMLAGATRGQGARRERTRPELFLSLTMPMPEYREQQWASRILQRLHKIPPYHSQTAAELDALLPSILDQAFRGEL